MIVNTLANERIFYSLKNKSGCFTQPLHCSTDLHNDIQPNM